MTKKTLKQIQTELKRPDGIPEGVWKIYHDLIPSVPNLVYRYIPRDRHPHTFEDCEAEALLEGFSFIRDTLAKKPASVEWPRVRWEFYLRSAFKNGIFKSIQHILYPIVIPRALMFSVKKYLTAVNILERYVGDNSLEFSDMYGIAFHSDCEILKCFNTSKCILNRKACVFDTIPKTDRVLLHMLIKGKKRSILSYAREYRKTLTEWVKLIREYKLMAASQISNYDQPTFMDLDNHVMLSTIKDRLNTIEPNLFEIYCMSLSDVNINTVIDQSAVEFPKGWLAHQIRLKFGINAQSLASLLKTGDEVVNELRKQHGLPALQRVVSLQPGE